MENTLNEWGLSHLWPSFQDQNIDDIEVLRSLTENDLNVVTNNIIGDKVRLKRGIELLAKTDEGDESDEPVRKKFNPIKQLNTEGDNPDAKIASTSILADTKLENLPVVFVENTSLSTVTLDSDLYPSSEDTIKTITYTEVLNLKQIFEQDLIGAALIQKCKCQVLTNSDRDRICDIVINSALNKYKKIDHNAFQYLAKTLTEIFPKEKETTYFVDAITKKESSLNKSERARGKLVDKYRNRLHLLKTINKSFQKTTEPGTSAEPELEEVNAEAQDSVAWLKLNFEPFSDVLRHWKITYPIRKNSKSLTIADYLTEWPVLQTQIAPELVAYDFGQVHQYQPPDISAEFPELFIKIFNTKKDTLSGTDDTIATLLQGDITRDSKTAIQLYLLPALLPPKGRTKINGKKAWKPSIAESRDALMVLVKTPGDVEKIKEERVNAMYKKGLTVQPYILLLGQHLGNVLNSFVVINNVEYKCDSVLDAVEFCFKAYQVLDAKYPYEVMHLWYLIQWVIFKYKTKKDIQIPWINEFL